MLSSSEIRQQFLSFFSKKGHQTVQSAPMVIKNDPTLMFTNAGMNQFKDIFLGDTAAKFKRVANTQKCLRVSGKHNDLEEVGIDTYHHTMFEMLGNWSFGDYFKNEAIAWAWELLTDVYKIPKDRLYVTVFEGDKNEKLDFDKEAFEYWKKHIPESSILGGNKKDNFWEMGDTGPCGTCSEIHIDLRNEDERKIVDAKTLVNTGHPQVIEIWNLVFIEFNRKADGSLEPLPARHVDTGMGFERLCMALQGKKSNYDTDVFQPLIQFISSRCGVPYGEQVHSSQFTVHSETLTVNREPSTVNREQTDIAMRVMSDHIRAIAFAIADGQLPSNNKAGYVIRRILRRAVRYAFTFLNLKEPFLHKLVPILSEQFKGIFPELKAQQEFIMRVIAEEETGFLRTLEAGIRRFEEHVHSSQFTVHSEPSTVNRELNGDFAFELYDTFGFPVDLTQLMAREKGLTVDMEGFNRCLEQQKDRSRAAAQVETEDWIEVREEDATEFLGYDLLECDTEIVRYRKVKSKGKEQYQLVLTKTPFYAESGGQVGDTGYLESEEEKIFITDTQKENNLIIHFVDKLPKHVDAQFHAVVNKKRRRMIMSNHSATHLMHSALKQVLGPHVNQKGSLVNEFVTRFDFSHFAKVSDEEIEKIEKLVNEKIREDVTLNEKRSVPVNEAKAMGATALFGEKYGDTVRVITFDPSYSRELCGGTHVSSTGHIGIFKIISETAIAAGVRRIEAITADKAEEYFRNQNKELNVLKGLLKNPKDAVKSMQAVLDENNDLRKKIDELILAKSQIIKQQLLQHVHQINDMQIIAEKVDLPSAETIKNISFELRNELHNSIVCLGAEIEGKAHLSVIISDDLVKEKKLNASLLIREAAKAIQGGGGGQPFYATAGGKNPEGIQEALDKIMQLLSEK